MKTTKYFVWSLTIISILSIVISGCKKEKNDMLQGLSGKFVFITDNNTIYLMDANGISKLIYDSTESFYNVKLSPDGLKISFVGNYYLNIMNINGTERKKIPGYFSHYDLAWSPNGTKIAFCNLLNDSICIMDADGSSMIKLTTGWNPCWSLDGLQLYFCISGALWSITLSDHSIHKLANLPESAGNLKWSQDRTKILYSSYPDYNIFMMNADGSGQTRLTKNLVESPTCFCWSPDGNKMAYTMYIPPRLYVMNIDGSNILKIIDGNYIVNSVTLYDGIISVDWH